MGKNQTEMLPSYRVLQGDSDLAEMLCTGKINLYSRQKNGAIAQLGERIVRNDEVAGSRPASSTK